MTAQCSAINKALADKRYTNSQLATEVGLSEQRVNAILDGSAKATPAEFNSIAKALNLSGNSDHAAKVTSPA